MAYHRALWLFSRQFVIQCSQERFGIHIVSVRDIEDRAVRGSIPFRGISDRLSDSNGFEGYLGVCDCFHKSFDGIGTLGDFFSKESRVLAFEFPSLHIFSNHRLGLGRNL